MSKLIHQNTHMLLFFIALLSINLLTLTACDRQSDNNSRQDTVITESVVKAPTPVQEHIPRDSNVIIENKSYLFDVSGHSIDELEALLTRAEEISQVHAPGYENIKIEMIIHGPDIEWFTQQNYEHNRQLIDLAARLDAYDIIDMKVCEETMSKRGVDRNDIPSFIESIPFAPIEIEKRLKEGYINL